MNFFDHFFSSDIQDNNPSDSLHASTPSDSQERQQDPSEKKGGIQNQSIPNQKQKPSYSPDPKEKSEKRKTLTLDFVGSTETGNSSFHASQKQQEKGRIRQSLSHGRSRSIVVEMSSHLKNPPGDSFKTKHGDASTASSTAMRRSSSSMSHGRFQAQHSAETTGLTSQERALRFAALQKAMEEQQKNEKSQDSMHKGSPFVSDALVSPVSTGLSTKMDSSVNPGSVAMTPAFSPENSPPITAPVTTEQSQNHRMIGENKGEKSLSHQATESHKESHLGLQQRSGVIAPIETIETQKTSPQTQSPQSTQTSTQKSSGFDQRNQPSRTAHPSHNVYANPHVKNQTSHQDRRFSEDPKRTNPLASKPSSAIKPVSERSGFASYEPRHHNFSGASQRRSEQSKHQEPEAHVSKASVKSFGSSRSDQRSAIAHTWYQESDRPLSDGKPKRLDFGSPVSTAPKRGFISMEGQIASALEEQNRFFKAHSIQRETRDSSHISRHHPSSERSTARPAERSIEERRYVPRQGTREQGQDSYAHSRSSSGYHSRQGGGSTPGYPRERSEGSGDERRAFQRAPGAWRGGSGSSSERPTQGGNPRALFIPGQSRFGLNKPLYDPNTQRIENQSPRREGVKENVREGQSFARNAYLETSNPYEKAKGLFSHPPKTGFNKKKQKSGYGSQRDGDSNRFAKTKDKNLHHQETDFSFRDDFSESSAYHEEREIKRAVIGLKKLRSNTHAAKRMAFSPREIILPLEAISIPEAASLLHLKQGSLIRMLKQSGWEGGDIISVEHIKDVIQELGHTPVQSLSLSEQEETLFLLASEKILKNQGEKKKKNTASSAAMGEKNSPVSGATQEIHTLSQSHPQSTSSRSSDGFIRPPLVAVMGHVDHGKTSLLDALRQTKVALGEAGGITQKIGAYQVFDSHGKSITFFDTPGHEAFMGMRKRGAQTADIAILVVAADDGVKAQTIEAIKHIRQSGVPMIVAINKIDVPGANPKRVREELMRYEIFVESMGGETLEVEVSAKTGQNLELLKETITLQAELLDLKVPLDSPAKGFLFESQMQTGKGIVAHGLAKQGTLHLGDVFVAGSTYGKIRALFDEHGQSITSAAPCVPVSIIGFDVLPKAGDTFEIVDSEETAKRILELREIQQQKIQEAQEAKQTPTSALLWLREQKASSNQKKVLRLILKAESSGTLEALRHLLQNLSCNNGEASVFLVECGIGPITEADVIRASTANATVIGFQVTPDAKAKAAVQATHTMVQTYTIIYRAVEGVMEMLRGLLSPVYEEVESGTALLRKVFEIRKIGFIAGCVVQKGVIKRNALCHVFRKQTLIGEGKIRSLKREKDEIKEALSGSECGILLEGFKGTFQEGDILRCLTKEIKTE